MVSHLVVIFATVSFVAFITAAKSAITSVNRAKLHSSLSDNDENSKTSKEILSILEEEEKYYLAIQTSLSLSCLLLGVYSTITLHPILDNFIVANTKDLSGIVGKPYSAIIDILVIILLVFLISLVYILLGKIIPSQLGRVKSYEVLKAVIKPLRVLAVITKPYNNILNELANVLFTVLGIEPNIRDDITEEEIRMLVNVGSETGNIDELEMEMIQNIFEFDDTTVGDICIHRLDVMSLSVNCSSEELLEAIKDQKYSRIPVYEENIDNIIGILYVKDIFKHYIINGDSLKEIKIREILRKPYLVPFSNKIDELFKDMQKHRIHMCVVVDEYGGTTGIVTMEDIVEEIMGNISDEYDGFEVPDIVEIDANTFKVNGATDLDELSKFLDEPMPVDDYDTVAGFIIAQLGRVPEDGENPEIEFNGILFKVSEIADKRIMSLMVVRTS